MKLGAQFYSIRTESTTPEKLLASMHKIKAIGYDVMQASGICQIEGAQLKSFIDETNLPITCTHRPYDEIVKTTKECIEFHKEINCPVIGIGSMPQDYRTSYEGLKEFKKIMAEPVKMIRDAGLRFAYHNHAFEFENPEGINVYDFLIEEMPDIDFILDVYWMHYAGQDYFKYIKLIAEAGRMTDIHFKDMKTEPKGPICPCGEGVIDFAPLVPFCKSLGIKNAHVEQDNAPDLGDVFEQMASSYKHLSPLFEV